MGGELGPQEAAAHLSDYRGQLARAKADLDALGQVQQANNGFAEFLDEFRQYADALAKTKAELGSGKFGELWEKAALDPSTVTAQDLDQATSAQEKVEVVRNLLEASVERFKSTHEQLDDALGSIAGGIEKTGKQLGRVTDKLGKLETWADRITNLPKMTGELTDDELIEAFTGYFGLLTDVLSGLSSLFPPLEAMLGWYGQVVAGLEQPLKAIAAGKARTNEAIAAYKRLLDDPYLKKVLPEPVTPYAAAVAEVDRLEGIVGQWEERVDEASGTLWNRLANKMEEQVLDQQLRERGQRADRVRPHVNDAMLAAAQPGASDAAVQRAKNAVDTAAELEQDFRSRLADHVAGVLPSIPEKDQGVLRVLYDRHDWLEDAVRARRAAAKTGAAGTTGPGPTATATTAAAAGGVGVVEKLLARPGMLAAMGVALLAAVGVSFVLGGEETAPASSDQPAVDAGSAPSADVAAPVEAVEDCTGPTLDDHELVLTSPAIPAGGAIPAPYNELTDQDGLSSPPLSWTGVPDGTVELAVMVVSTSRPEAQAFLSEPAPWGTAESMGTDELGYLGDARWRVTGIDPGLDGLPAMTYFEAIDAGLSLHPVGVSSQLDGQDVSGFYEDPDPNDTALFTLFALCEPSSEWPSDSGPPVSWLAQNAITYAHFAATGS